jgi:uncharacterized pyridoxal phosphate-containing UPF0001 family protein
VTRRSRCPTSIVASPQPEADVLVQVNTSGEVTKSGLTPDQVDEFTLTPRPGR